MPELPSRRLEGFGAVFRDHFGSDYEFYLLLKQGHGGYRYHRTEGSFLLFVGGRPLIYDGGEAGETWRHSTLSFYDAEMPLASGHVERFHTLPGLGFVQGVHPVPIKPGDPVFLSDNCHHRLVPVAYERFAAKNPADVRSIMVVRDEYVVLHDDLCLEAGVSCRWHLQVVSDSHQGNAQEGYLFKGRFGVDLQVLFPDQVFSEAEIQQLPILDYTQNGIRPAAESFSMRHLSVRAESPKGYVAILRPLTQGRKQIQVRSLNGRNGQEGVAITGNGIDDHLFLSRQNFIFDDEGSVSAADTAQFYGVLRIANCFCWPVRGLKLKG